MTTPPIKKYHRMKDHYYWTNGRHMKCPECLAGSTPLDDKEYELKVKQE